MSEVDINDVVFDPAIHQEKDGKPVLNKDGSFRKRGGRPKGSENKDGKYTDKALVRSQLVKAAVQYRNEDGKKVDAIRKICDNIVDLAVKGDKWAIEFYTENTEGKVSQNINLENTVTHRLEEIPIKFVDAIDVTPEKPLLNG